MYTLRTYQEEAVWIGTNFFKSKAKHNSIIVVPTGGGKALIISGIAKQLFPEPCLVLQPTKEILEQNIEKFRNFGGIATIYSASFNQKNISQVTYATIGSIIRKKELFKDFKYVIIDECHFTNAKGGMYEEFLNYLNVKTLGLTATAYRLSTDGYGGSMLKFLTRTRPRIFKDVIYYIQNKTLFDAGYLSPLEYVNIGGFDISQIKLNTTGADFDDNSLKRYFNIINHTDRVTEVVKDLLNNKSHPRKGIIVFNRFVKEAQDIKTSLGTNNVEILTATTKKKDRTQIIKDFRNGNIKVILNVNILGIGFDYPELDTIVLARPTMSLALYYQFIGRAIRPHPDKDKALIIDLCDNYNRFGKIEDLTFNENNGLYFISSKERQLTNVYYNKDTSVKMPFGKYKDQPINRIPKYYLTWLLKNTTLKPELKLEIQKAL
jgi:DNA repair protein RadD